MHNCKRTRNVLLDFAMGELSQAQSAALMSQMRECDPCRTEYAAIAGTLRVSRKALEAEQRSDEFWQRYHHRLQSRLNELPGATIEQSRRVRVLNVLKAFTSTSVRVPLPAAAAAMALVCALSFAALSRNQVVNAVPTTPVTRVEVQTVQVPVVHEKVVRQVIYKERKRSRVYELDYANLKTATATVKADPAPASKLNLVGFKPADLVNMTIIKENDQDEK